MRYVIFLLFAMNCAYFSWQVFLEGSVKPAERLLPPLPLDVRRLVTIQERDAQQSTSETRKIEGLTTTQPPGAVMPLSCQALGPFLAQSELTKFEKRLDRLGLTARSQTRYQREQVGYTVLLTSAGYEEALQNKRRLEKENITTSFIGVNNTPNEPEAKTVRHIFERFVKLGSSTHLVKELRLDGVTSKAWTTQEGRVREGKPIDKSLIYKILSNRVYLGEIRHRDQWYPGEHPPIVDRTVWDAIQAILAKNPRVRANDTRARVPFLLKGLLQGSDGRALTPWFTRKKNGRLYRYYLPVRENKEHAGASGLPRLPAGELEAAVLEQMRRVLRAPEMVAGVTEQATRLDPTLDEAQVAVAMTRLEAIWEQLFPAEQQRIVRLLIEKVIVSPNDLEVRFRPNGIEVLALELQPEPAVESIEEAVA